MYLSVCDEIRSLGCDPLIGAKYCFSAEAGPSSVALYCSVLETWGPAPGSERLRVDVGSCRGHVFYDLLLSQVAIDFGNEEL